MQNEIQVSVVIPTCDRSHSLLRVLKSLNQSEYNSNEVIIIDSGNIGIDNDDLKNFNNLTIQYFRSERSVCIQRNFGIAQAKSDWIFLCDDDLEIPTDYIAKLINHLKEHPEAGCASGIILQKVEDEWKGEYALTSWVDLIFRFVFPLSIWGSIEVPQHNFLIRSIKNYYTKKGNHLSKAGWPIVTDFSGDYFKTPFYGLGASIVKTKWLINSPYDEILDSHGIGDNFGVASSFPSEGIHVVKSAFVYHHQHTTNRLPQSVSYYRRILALDYFLKTKKELSHIRRAWFLWSLVGNLFMFVFSGKILMAATTLKLLKLIFFENNPYVMARQSGVSVIKPAL